MSSTIPKAESVGSDLVFNGMTPRLQLAILEDEKNVALQDLAFATKNYEKLIKSLSQKRETVGEKMANACAEIQEKWQKIYNSMMVAVNPLLGPFKNIGDYDKSGELLDLAIDQMLKPLTEGIKPFLELSGMPKLPLLDSLQDILQSVKDMARVQQETKKYMNKLQAQQSQNHEDGEDGVNKDAQNGNWMADLKKSFGEIFSEIGKLLIILGQQLVMFILFFFYNLISELIELLKPVFQAFGIVVGTFIGMLTRIKDVLDGGMNIGAIILMILKLIWNRLRELYNILYLFSPESKNDQIDAMRWMIAKNKVRLEYCSLNTASSMAQLRSDELARWRFDKTPNIAEIRKDAKETIEKTKNAVEEFEPTIDSRIEKYESDLKGAGATVPA